jgi:hypothetical protein
MPPKAAAGAQPKAGQQQQHAAQLSSKIVPARQQSGPGLLEFDPAMGKHSSKQAPGFLGIDPAAGKPVVKQAPSVLGTKAAATDKPAAKQAPKLSGFDPMGQPAVKQAPSFLGVDPFAGKPAARQAPGLLQYEAPNSKPAAKQAPGLLQYDPPSSKQAGSKAPGLAEFDPVVGKHLESKTPGFLGIDPGAGEPVDYGRQVDSPAPQEPRDPEPYPKAPPPQCLEGPCCDTDSKTYLPKGTSCRCDRPLQSSCSLAIASAQHIMHLAMPRHIMDDAPSNAQTHAVLMCHVNICAWESKPVTPSAVTMLLPFLL